MKFNNINKKAIDYVNVDGENLISPSTHHWASNPPSHHTFDNECV